MTTQDHLKRQFLATCPSTEADGWQYEADIDVDLHIEAGLVLNYTLLLKTWQIYSSVTELHGNVMELHERIKHQMIHLGYNICSPTAFS